MHLNEQINATGYLELECGVRLQCEFEILQYFDGSLAIECKCADDYSGFFLLASVNKPARGIVGRTAIGQVVASHDEIQILGIDGDSATLSTNGITISDAEQRGNAHRFLLTNLAFPSVLARTMPTPVALTIPTEPAHTQVTLVPRPDYQERERLQRRHKQPTPTAFLQFDSSESLSAVEELAGEICTALSIVQGHKVNWISHEVADSDGKVCYRRLHNRATKRSSGLALNRQGGNNERLPLTAVQECFSRVRDLQRAYGWNGPVLEIWLEARTDADYLETRALKFVTVVEALRTVVLRDEARSTIIQQSMWDAFKEHILPLSREYLASELKIHKQEVETLTAAPRWEQINRKSFRSQINAAFKKLGVEEPSRSVELFISSRNKLIHAGSFRCNSDREAVQAEKDAPQDQIAEYLFIAGFVDRVIMQAVGLGSYPSTS